jgi:mono/diheme cytochrome c family protein
MNRVFVSLLVLFVISAAGFAVVRTQAGKGEEAHSHDHSHAPEKGATSGKDVFQSTCAGCHFADSTDSKYGPGLKGIFDQSKLPASGRPVTEENIRDQLKNPYDKMPAVADDMTPEQIDAVLEYLKTL